MTPDEAIADLKENGFTVVKKVELWQKLMI